MDLLTIGDFYRKRYGAAAELVTSLCITISYLGWTSAQMIALGLVFNALSGGAIPMPVGIMLGAGVVLVYTLFGGMWSVAFTDIFQTVIIVAGLLYLAWLLADMAGGAGAVIAHATAAGKFQFWPQLKTKEVLAFFAAFLTPRSAASRSRTSSSASPRRRTRDGGPRVASRRRVLLRRRVRARVPRLFGVPDRAGNGRSRSSRPKATATRRSCRR